MGTHWEQRENEKIPPLPLTPTQNLKEKESRHFLSAC